MVKEQAMGALPRRILVTGGCGFIGSWIIRRIFEQNPDAIVVNLDLLTYAGNPDNLRDVENRPGYTFVHGDIRDRELVSRVMQDIDAVIHSAAETHVDRSISNPSVFVETNVLGTQILLEEARQQGVGKFVLVSTDEVYGSLPLDTPELFTEQTPIQPSSPYAASKASADLMALAAYHTYGQSVCITRCGNNYGPYQYPEKLIPFFILNLLKGEPVPVYGDGLNVRDWIYVADHADAVLAVLAKGQPGDVYNIGARNQQNNVTMTRTLLAALQQPESMIRWVADRPGHDRRYALDTTKITTQLGWQPQYQFNLALAETIAWYQNNLEWIDRVKARAEREKTEPGALWLVQGS